VLGSTALRLLRHVPIPVLIACGRLAEPKDARTNER